LQMYIDISQGVFLSGVYKKIRRVARFKGTTGLQREQE